MECRTCGNVVPAVDIATGRLAPSQCSVCRFESADAQASDRTRRLDAMAGAMVPVMLRPGTLIYEGDAASLVRVAVGILRAIDAEIANPANPKE